AAAMRTTSNARNFRTTRILTTCRKVRHGGRFLHEEHDDSTTTRNDWLCSSGHRELRVIVNTPYPAGQPTAALSAARARGRLRAHRLLARSGRLPGPSPAGRLPCRRAG